MTVKRYHFIRHFVEAFDDLHSAIFFALADMAGITVNEWNEFETIQKIGGIECLSLSESLTDS